MDSSSSSRHFHLFASSKSWPSFQQPHFSAATWLPAHPHMQLKRLGHSQTRVKGRASSEQGERDSLGQSPLWIQAPSQAEKPPDSCWGKGRSHGGVPAQSSPGL